MPITERIKKLQRYWHDETLTLPQREHPPWFLCDCGEGKRLRMDTGEGNINTFILNFNLEKERLSELFIETDPISDDMLSRHIEGLQDAMFKLKTESQAAVSLRADRRKKLSDEQRRELEAKDRKYIRDKNNDDKPKKERVSSIQQAKDKLSALGIDFGELMKNHGGK